ncbi:hypothetical protein G7Y89_g11134 [Cudoniella acicularis]|uniref:tRNA-intron lyase n=1 Tax=Cudoniella acicularis TaxID=354080 RepID=A0A8H4RCH7_9HELO|nr:hypothetical protein G7Y89_g11134 [Cudoniella acicularis]
MADTQNLPIQVDVSPTPPAAEVKPPKPPRPSGPTRHQQLNKLYALPAPLRTFPLPTFVPHNPLSLFHILYAWVSQVIKPQPSHFEPLYQGWFSPETRSVHVTDIRSIRGLWEQGFYGKGNLSRSEPSWLEREKTRRGDKARTTSEELTRRRRLERQQVKWERARKEREAIDQRLLDEAAVALENGNVEAPTAIEINGEGLESQGLVLASTDIVEGIPVLELEPNIQEVKESIFSGDSEANGVESTPVPEIETIVLEEAEESAIPQDPSEAPRITEDACNLVLNGVDSDLVLFTTKYPSPVGPLELLALPNSANNSPSGTEVVKELSMPVITRVGDHTLSHLKRIPSPVGPSGILSPPNFAVGSWLDTSSEIETVGFGHRYSCEVSVNSSAPIKSFIAPVGPMEILALPNSIEPVTPPVELAECISPIVAEPVHGGAGPEVHRELPENLATSVAEPEVPVTEVVDEVVANSIMNGNGSLAPVTPAEVTETIDTSAAEPLDKTAGPEVLDEVVGGPIPNGNGTTYVNSLGMNEHSTGIKALDIDSSDETGNGSSLSEETIDANGSASSAPLDLTTPGRKRQKSVRFSPTVEKNTFIQSEPPSPDRGVNTAIEEPLVIKQQEHTQLTLEEAFFLSYGLGALTVLDPSTNSPISNKNLFALFRKTSYFPPRDNHISPDDPFMLNYIVYHHYRSLGWVPRSGIKFSVDLMLYMRGPVFTHAEFGVIILPSYSDPYWSSTVSLQEYAKSKQRRTWAWMNCINRVISQVKKSLILTYVDIPEPLSAEEENQLGIDGVLGRYKVREFVLKRWVANRSRD